MVCVFYGAVPLARDGRPVCCSDWLGDIELALAG